jgi:hypothetical protein
MSFHVFTLNFNYKNTFDFDYKNLDNNAKYFYNIVNDYYVGATWGSNNY